MTLNQVQFDDWLVHPGTVALRRWIESIGTEILDNMQNGNSDLPLAEIGAKTVGYRAQLRIVKKLLDMEYKDLTTVEDQQ